MKAEISYPGYRLDDRYSSVYQQQGRMLTDRDWNEMSDVLRSLLTEVAREAIGTGAPRIGGLLEKTAGGGIALRTEGGRVVAKGRIGKVVPRDPTTGAPIYLNQDDLPESYTDSTGTPQTLLGAAPAVGSILYVDIWDRTVTAFDLPHLMDAALHGADTCFRLQRLAQIKFASADDLPGAGADPCNPQFDPGRIPEKGDAVFDIELTDPSEASDACDPCAELVDLEASVDNYLFRLEVHDVAYDTDRRPTRIVLKWSDANGSRQYGADELDLSALDPAHVYEFFNDDTEFFLGMPSDDWPVSAELRGRLDPATPADVAAAFPRLREWDGYCVLEWSGADWAVTGGRNGAGLFSETSNAAVDAGTLTVALDGKSFSLELTGRQFLAGDYWLALARTRAPEGEKLRPLTPEPFGVPHRYCLLGVVDGTNGETRLRNPTAADLRRLNHPPLTCIDAGDVGYETDCPSGLFTSDHDTVKKALDQVCRIDAEHISYGTTCPSGLFEASHDTVEKALDRICEIEAKHVGFEKPCDTSLYRGKSISTVADALSLMCDVRADQIGYDPKCEFLIERETDNVQDAIDQLCNAMDRKEELPRVAEVGWNNDAAVTLAAFRQGLKVVFSEAMAENTISTDTFTVTIEWPNAESFSRGLPAFSELAVCGRIRRLDAGSFSFLPGWGNDDGPLIEAIGQAMTCKPDFEGLRCRVRLRGTFIRNSKQDKLLDGHVPGAIGADNRIDLKFGEPGVGHASDFESWFYLVRNPELPRLDLNLATEAALRAELGLTERQAKAVIAARNRLPGRKFTNIDQLLNVNGIGDGTMNRIRSMVTL